MCSLGGYVMLVGTTETRVHSWTSFPGVCVCVSVCVCDGSAVGVAAMFCNLLHLKIKAEFGIHVHL